MHVLLAMPNACWLQVHEYENTGATFSSCKLLCCEKTQLTSLERLMVTKSLPHAASGFTLLNLLLVHLYLF